MNPALRRLLRFAAMLGSAAGLCAALGGCTNAGTGAAAEQPSPAVTVSLPIQRRITDYAEYTGRSAAVDSVQVRARVSGYLQQIHFKEGSDVHKGDVLYEIDARPYQAALQQAQAQVSLQQAQLTYQDAVYRRNVRLQAEGQAVSVEELQQSRAQRDTTTASLQAARAAVEQAKLNLGWTKVTSPIDGLIGRTLVTLGNLVVADQTLLTTIVSQDPMYAYFDVDEPTMLRVRELIREGKYKSAREPGSRVPVFLGLATEQGYAHEGYVDFINNQVVAATGTLPIRGVFANPRPPVGPRLLAPGMFVRIRVAVSPPYTALLVTQAAVGADQNVNFVYVVDDQNRVDRHDVQLGPPRGNDLQVIAAGLEPDERVVVDGLQHVRPGMTVNPTLVPMPQPSHTGGSAPNSSASAGGFQPPAGAPARAAPARKESYPPHGQAR